MQEEEEGPRASPLPLHDVRWPNGLTRFVVSRMVHTTVPRSLPPSLPPSPPVHNARGADRQDRDHLGEPAGGRVGNGDLDLAQTWVWSSLERCCLGEGAIESWNALPPPPHTHRLPSVEEAPQPHFLRQMRCCPPRTASPLTRCVVRTCSTMQRGLDGPTITYPYCTSAPLYRLAPAHVTRCMTRAAPRSECTATRGSTWCYPSCR